MARIQKKKTASKTKKQKTGDPAQGVGGGNGGSTRPEALSSLSSPAAEKKKKTYSAKRPSDPGQSTVMMLAEKYFGSWMQFFREVRVELSKVTWPTKKQTIGSTVVVIIFVFVISIFLGVVDIGLSNLIRFIL